METVQDIGQDGYCSVPDVGEIEPKAAGLLKELIEQPCFHSLPLLQPDGMAAARL